jgi:hypothetical protein
MMHCRLIKEARALFLPCSVALLASVLMGLGLFTQETSQAAAWDAWVRALTGFLFGLAPVMFIGSVVVMAGMAFGSEFQCRTITLWLSQGVTRMQLWKEKMLALAIAVITSGIAGGLCLLAGHWLAGSLLGREWRPMSDPFREDFLWAIGGSGLFFASTVCSVCFWTLLGRSALGGIVFSLGSQFVLLAAILFSMDKLFGDNNEVKAGAVAIAGLAYATVFFWLGRRSFNRFESRDSVSWDGGLRMESLGMFRISATFLRCAPTAPLWNLIRKEIGLSRPLYVIAALFVICWLVSVGAYWLTSGHRSALEVVFGVMFAVYMSVITVLSGCIGLIEEKNLGTYGWHLTLPIGSRRQWLVKLAMALAHGFVLALLLPWLLALMIAPGEMVGIFREDHNGPLGAGLVAWAAAILFSFWAATLVNTSARAVLTALLGLIGVFACVLAGNWCAGQIQGANGDFAGWLLFLRLSSSAFVTSPVLAFVVFAGPTLTILLQSFLQFRRIQPRPFVLFKYTVIVSLIVFLTAFWSGL